MDFQKILELASKNQKVAEKKLTETKRYSSTVPPPKKEPRPAVNPDAIRARIDQKEQERQQKLIEDERKRKEGAKRQLEAERKAAEEKRNNRKASRKAKASPDPKRERKPSGSSEDSSRRGEGTRYQDKEHEVVHKSFMQKVEKNAKRHREKVVRKETEVRPSKPKPSKKKAPPASKKPMSYEELLKFAEQQKTGNIEKRDGRKEEDSEDSEEEESEEEEYDHRPKGRDNRPLDRNKEQSRESKIKERLKEERLKRVANGNNQKNLPGKQSRAPSQDFKNDRNRPSPSLVKDGKGHRHSSEAERNIMRNAHGSMKTSGVRKEGRVDTSRKPAGDRVGVGDDRKKVNSTVPSKMGEKQAYRTGDRVGSGDDRRKMNSSVPSRIGEKQANRSGERLVSKTAEKTSGSCGKQPVRPTETKAVRTSDKLPRRPAEKLPVRPGERPLGKPQGRPESRPVAGKPSRPSEHQDVRGRERPRPMNHDRERPKSSGMGLLRGSEVMRKRPAKPPIMHVKRGRVMVSDSEESDYDDGDGFIDDTPLDEGRGADVSSYIKEIFGYDKSKYGYESDYALRAMDASYRDIQREESRSARLGMLEDLEDMRREKEEMKRKAMKKAKKR